MSSIHELNSVVDEIFLTLEEVKSLFHNWNASCHMTFIQKVMYLNELREGLYKLGFDEDFTDTVIKVAYSNVFTKNERIEFPCGLPLTSAFLVQPAFYDG